VSPTRITNGSATITSSGLQYMSGNSWARAATVGRTRATSTTTRSDIIGFMDINQPID
jgi:hypothetical protein